MLVSRILHTEDCQGGRPAPPGGRRCIRVPCYVWLLFIVLVIIIYGAVLRKTGGADVLERKVIDDPAVANFDGWAGTHVIFWAFLGFLYPGKYVQALTVSLLWEGIEDFLGRNRMTVGGSRLQLVGATDDTGQTEDDNEAFWYGRYTTDPFFNMTGYILGSAAAERWWPSYPCSP